MSRSEVRLSDVRGYGRLGVEAATGVAAIVERIHTTVLNTPGPFGVAARALTGDVTAFVYRAVRSGMQLTGAGIDVALKIFEGETPAESSPGRDMALAALNGVIGDHLAATQNPLALPMRLRHDGRALPDDAEALAAALPHASAKILVLAHGLCMTDLQWTRRKHNHGVELAGRFGMTPLFLFYNSGQHISVNGRAFAAALDSLTARWPVPVEEIVLIGHSMGGLVARSACHAGAAAGHAWPAKLTKLFFLGTPHHGAPLERIGAWAGHALDRIPYAAAFGGPGRMRSAGVTDLRYGALSDEDWAHGDRFDPRAGRPRIVPLPAGVACHAVAATTARGAETLTTRLIGDGLVDLASALGAHDDPDRDLGLPAAQRWIARGANHFDLLDRRDVCEQLALWLAAPVSRKAEQGG